MADLLGAPLPGTPRPYHFPAFERRALANGLTVWLVPIEGAALTNAHFLSDAGAAAEDEVHAGVAALTAQLLVTGTRRLDAAEFAEATERLGIEVGSESSWDSSRAAFQALPTQLDAGLALLAEMLREPRLDPGEFDRLKSERLADILQARAEPGRLADEAFLGQVFDPATPYRRISAGTPETVAGLGLDDVRAFHATQFLPGRAHLVIAGAIRADAVMRRVEAEFGDWQGTGAGHRQLEPRAAGGRRVVIVDRPGSVQTELRVGHVGIDRYDPRYFAALVMAALLGGVFNSRLNSRLREELGYTYGAAAGFDPRRFRGPLRAAAAVHTEVTASAISEMLSLIEGIRGGEPTAAELNQVRDFLVGVFPLRFETTGGVASAIEPIAIYGLPDAWWTTYRAHLEAVSAADVREAADALIHPDQLVVVAVGDAAAIRPAIEAAGVGRVELATVESATPGAAT